MKTLFHGTTIEAYNKIKVEGFNPSKTNWNCSYNSELYFYDLDKTDEDSDEIEWCRNECIQRAFESAQLAAAIQGVSASELIVIEIKIEEKYTEDDESCENMADIATVVNIQDLNEFGIVANIFLSKDYVPSLRLFYCASLIVNNQYIETNNFSSQEIKACTKMVENGIYLEDIYPQDWENLNIELSLKD